MVIDNKVNKVFKQIKNISGNSPDLNTRTINIMYKKVGYIYFESVSSDDKISNFFISVCF